MVAEKWVKNNLGIIRRSDSFSSPFLAVSRETGNLGRKKNREREREREGKSWWKKGYRYLRGKLSTKTFADENGVWVHEIAKTVMNTVYEYGFHGCFFVFFLFFFFRFAEGERGRRVLILGVFLSSFKSSGTCCPLFSKSKVTWYGFHSPNASSTLGATRFAILPFLDILYFCL